MRNTYCTFIFIFFVLSVTGNVSADDTIDEVIITASFTNQSLAALNSSLHVVDGSDIENDASRSLGESIDNLLGVSSSDFGAAVGQPVIRGLSGARVKILNNNYVVRDVSTLGGDHLNDVDLNKIEQIEIIRGPSSLLFSKGTSGGVINIVDNTIAKKDFSESIFNIGGEASSVNDGFGANLNYQGNISRINVSAAYNKYDHENYEVPEGAVMEEEHEEEHGEEGPIKFLENSDYQRETKRFGLSRVGSWGYFGVSFSDNDSLYGIPFHEEGEGHHEGEHEGEDDHDEEAEHEDEHEDERIFSTTDSQVYTFEGRYNLDNSLVSNVEYFFRNSDYAHIEQHAEEEGEEHSEEEHGDEEHEEEAPTLFSNDSTEFGLRFSSDKDSLNQKLVLNFIDEKVTVIGEEAFVPPTTSKEITMGYYLSKDFSLFDLSLALRHDFLERKNETLGQEVDRDATSLSLSLSRNITQHLSVNLGISSIARVPSPVELYINGPHLSAARFEVGDVNLSNEKSKNIDLNLSYQNSGFFSYLSIFRNDINNYIYLEDQVGEEEDGLLLAFYKQNDSVFKGYEFKIGQDFKFGENNIRLSYGRDSVRAQFDNDINVPRIIPPRNTFRASYDYRNSNFLVNLKNVEKQDNTFLTETATDGYDMLDARFTQKFLIDDNTNLTLSFFGKNMFNEIARNHTSFVKDSIPLPGRNYGMKFYLKFVR